MNLKPGEMSPDKFSHEVVATSRTFYRDQDLRVVIEGDTAKTDGTTVYIPAMSMDAGVDIQRQRITRGYVDHEAGHGRHTVMDEARRAAPYRYAKHMANAMEDVRIEALIINEYPGAQKNLEAVTEAVNNMFIKHAATDPTYVSDFNRVGAVAVTWEGRRRLGYDCPSIATCLAMLPTDVMDKVNKVADMAQRSGSTKDVVDFAILLNKEMEDEDVAKGKGLPGGGGASYGKGKGKPGVGTGHVTGGPKPHTTTGADAMYSADAADALNELTAMTPGVRGGGYRVWTWDRDHIWHKDDTAKGSSRSRARFLRWREQALTTGDSDYTKAVSSIGSHVNMMRRKLERALVTKMNRGVIRNQEDGQLDSRRLVAAYGGRTNVHKQREKIDDLDVSVMLVVDLSGSMSGEKIRLARAAAICYAEALDKVQIPFAIGGFTCNERAHETLNPKNSDSSEMMYRNYPLDLYVFKKFDEPLKNARAAVGAMNGGAIAMGNNADGDSILQFYRKFMANRKEKRRVMIVFSDGQPAATGGDQDQRLRDVIAYIEGEKVDMIGVGILSEAPKKFYKKHVLVMSLPDLAKSSLDILARLLIDPKFKVDNTELMGSTEKLTKRS